MKNRRLGRSGITVPPLALGGNVFGWTVDEETAFAVLDAYAEAGFSLIDTADVYPRWAPGSKGGESEAIIGRWMRERRNRDKMVIATKVGSEMGPGKRGLGRKYILEAAEASLKRLRTDRIDLYQAHRDDPATPMEETLSAYAALMEQGKVRAIGASNFTAERLNRALAVSTERGLPRYESLQPQYNLYDRQEFERTLAPFCLKQGIGVITYYSLASGFLTGKYRSPADQVKSVRGSRAALYLTDRGYRILAALDKVAQKHHAEVATVALAWLIAQPAVTAPIASATTVEQVRAITAAPKLALDAEDLKALTRASDELPVRGKAA